MIEAIVLGIIEGLTEFLPVSSTGHLILVSRYLKQDGVFANAFSVIIQAGAIMAVVFYFWRLLVPDLKEQGDLKNKAVLWSKVVVGTIPAVLVAFPLEELIDKYLFHTVPVAIALIVGAFLLMWSDTLKHHKSSTLTLNDLSYKHAFGVGLFQCMALFPGMSRSASTIIGGLALGLKRDIAAEFSFFLALPILGGAALLKVVKYGGTFSSEQWGLLGVGTLTSFVVAYLVIAVFMRFIKKHSFMPFAIYRILLGIAVLALA